jgi:hypothetical protein
MTKRELMDEAASLDIPGRSYMNKAELEVAVGRARRRHGFEQALHNPGVHVGIHRLLEHVFRYLR